MKFIGRFVALLFVLVAGSALAQTVPSKPDSVQFYTDPIVHIYETVFNIIGNEKIVYHREYLYGEWEEVIIISSPTLVARKFPFRVPAHLVFGFSDGYRIKADQTVLVSGFPDGYKIKFGLWNQFVPPDVPTVVPEKYKQYLRIARDLSVGKWPGVFPR